MTVLCTFVPLHYSSIAYFCDFFHIDTLRLISFCVYVSNKHNICTEKKKSWLKSDTLGVYPELHRL